MKKPQVLLGLLAAVGTAIGVLVAVIGLPYGRMNYTAFAVLYHGGTPTTTPFVISVDCDLATSGIQDNCFINVPNASRNIGVVFENDSGGSVIYGTFNWHLNNDNSTAMNPGPLLPANLNSNPDFNDTEFPPTLDPGTNCAAGGPANPISDTGALGAGQSQSSLACFSITTPSFASGTAVVSGFVKYNTSAAVAGNVSNLSLDSVNVTDDQFAELASCNPTNITAADCFGAKVTFQNPPTATPTVPGPTATNTPIPPTATNTPIPPTATSTNTATATPAGSFVVKVPAGDANNTGPGPSANLYLCYTGPCSGPGEGDLRVVEHAGNVQTGDQDGNTTQDGLGAYEFSVEYDKDVISSVNPCDIVFGPGGAGASRGPVDELNTSSINPDCTPDPNVQTDGSCSFSLILENVIHFGCVTTGFSPDGPTGAMDIASLDLIPSGDLANDIFPGNNNGVLTVIKDTGCELVDIFGHPTLGSVNGGLTPICGDLAVTVRILEGDLNLDCTVDLNDEALISYRYGSFFGSLLYSKWFDLEPALHDLDIDIKDIQKVFGRDGSTCQNPIPPQLPLPPPFPF